MGIFFVVLLVFFTLSLDYFFSVRSQRDYGDALATVQTLAAEADNIYSQGAGAEKIVKVVLPPSTSFTQNTTFIGRPLNSITGKSNTISVGLPGATVSASTAETVVGAFPSYSGTHLLRVTSYGNFVGIGSHLVSADPATVFASTGRGTQTVSTITFSSELSSSTNNSINVTLGSAWNYTNVNLSIAPSTFSTYGFTDVPVTLTFQANANAVGIYTSTLNVTAVRQASDGSVSARETFTIPLTLEVS